MLMRLAVCAFLTLIATARIRAGVFAGLAVGIGDERCVAFDGYTPTIGETLTLVYPQSRQWTALATVGPRVAKCPSLLDTDLAGPYHSISSMEEPGDKLWVAIALPGKRRVRIEKEGVSAELNGRPPREFLRVCTTTDGAHYTIWSGAPITGRRLWYAYVEAGYELEPSCMEEEFVQP